MYTESHRLLYQTPSQFLFTLVFPIPSNNVPPASKSQSPMIRRGKQTHLSSYKQWNLIVIWYVTCVVYDCVRKNKCRKAPGHQHSSFRSEAGIFITAIFATEARLSKPSPNFDRYSLLEGVARCRQDGMTIHPATVQRVWGCWLPPPTAFHAFWRRLSLSCSILCWLSRPSIGHGGCEQTSCGDLLPCESLASGWASMGCQWPCCCSSGFSHRRALKVNGRGTDCMSTCTFRSYADLGRSQVRLTYVFHFLIFSGTLIGIRITPSFAQLLFEATGSWNYEWHPRHNENLMCPHQTILDFFTEDVWHKT